MAAARPAPMWGWNWIRTCKEDYLAMNQREIIFFDELGFGWVVDKAVIHAINACSNREDLIVEKTLADLLRRA